MTYTLNAGQLADTRRSEKYPGPRIVSPAIRRCARGDGRD